MGEGSSEETLSREGILGVVCAFVGQIAEGLTKESDEGVVQSLPASADLGYEDKWKGCGLQEANITQPVFLHQPRPKVLYSLQHQVNMGSLSDHISVSDQHPGVPMSLSHQ